MKDIKFDNSQRLYKEALKYLPFGVSSNARLWRQICPTNLPCTIFVKKAQGSHIWDVDDNKYIDYRLGYGPVILGHGHNKVTERVRQVEEKGAVYALGNELEITVAKKICSMVPCADMVRFSVTGTEATMTALRVARAAKKKYGLVKFVGHYHGHHDAVLFSTAPRFKDVSTKIKIVASQGIPPSTQRLVHVARWNNFEQVEKIVKKHAKELGAIICEPVAMNMSTIPPKPGFLKHLRELCDKYDVTLIFDEVKTGFRLHPGGAQTMYKVTPDLAAFAKAMGNGYPISAIAGKKEYMEKIGPGGVSHGGTYASNPISLAAADATLDEIKSGRVHNHLNKYGKKMMHGISDIFRDRKVAHLIQGFPSAFNFLFTKQESVSEYSELAKCDFAMYAKLNVELMKAGVMLDEDNGEPIYTSYSHKDKDLWDTLEAFDKACYECIKTMKR